MLFIGECKLGCDGCMRRTLFVLFCAFLNVRSFRLEFSSDRILDGDIAAAFRKYIGLIVYLA
jgi:hypothetical protein